MKYSHYKIRSDPFFDAHKTFCVTQTRVEIKS
jgi:hypothetical protein